MRKLKIAKWLYRHFGIILPCLREKWNKDAKFIQFKLDNLHDTVNRYNQFNGTNYTSKKVLEIICK